MVWELFPLQISAWRPTGGKNLVDSSALGTHVKVKVSGTLEDKDGHHGNFRIVQDVLGEPESSGPQHGGKVSPGQRLRDETDEVRAGREFYDDEGVWVDQIRSFDSGRIGQKLRTNQKLADTILSLAIPKDPMDVIDTNEVIHGGNIRNAVETKGMSMEIKSDVIGVGGKVTKTDVTTVSGEAQEISQEGPNALDRQDDGKQFEKNNIKIISPIVESSKDGANPMHRDMTVQSILDNSLQQLRDWMENEAAATAANSAAKSEGFENARKPVVAEDAYLIGEGQFQNKNDYETERAMGGAHTLIEDTLDGTNIIVLERKPIKMNVSNTQANNNLETTGNRNVLPGQKSSLFVNENVDKPKTGKTPDDGFEDPKLKSKSVEGAVVTEKANASTENRGTNGKDSPHASHSQMNKTNEKQGVELSGKDGPNRVDILPALQLRRTKRNVAREPPGWWLHEDSDKTQRRSVGLQGEPGSRDGETTPPLVRHESRDAESTKSNNSIAQDRQADQFLFELGYRRFLEKIASEEKNKAIKKGVKLGGHIDDKEGVTSEDGDKEREQSITSDNQAAEKGIFRDVRKEVKSEMDVELPAPVETRPESLSYEIRDDKGETGDYDDWEESVEFRRRRSPTGLRGRATKHRPGHKRARARFRSKREHEGRSKSALMERSRLVRSPGHDEAGRSSKKSSNHTLLDEADILFIVKHKQPSKATPKKSKSDTTNSLGGNSVKKNNNNNKMNGPSPGEEIKDQITYFKNLYRLKPDKDKAPVGKSSRHVPNVGPHVMVTDGAEKKEKSTSLPSLAGPSIQSKIR